MDTETKNEPKSKDGFYAIVSAIARFVETADNDITPKKQEIREEV